MPAAAFRLPISVSQNGKCIMNLRGIGTTNDTIYNYAKIADPFASTDNLTTSLVSGTGAGSWSNQIKYAYKSNSESSPALIQDSMAGQSSTSGVIFIRIKISGTSTQTTNQCILAVGTEGVTGYGIVASYESGYKIFFVNIRDLTIRIQISSGTVNTGQWYSYSVKFNTISGTTRITSYENGTQTQNASALSEVIDSPSGFVFLFSPGLALALNPFYGEITDFAIVEDSSIANARLIAFNTAPYL